MNRILPWGILATIAVALAACNSNNDVASTPGPCGTPPGVTTTQLVYPAPGATSVPDSFGQVIVASNNAITGGNWDIELFDTIGDIYQGGGFGTAPSPLPSPNQKPSITNPVYQTSTFSGLNVAGTTLAAYLNNTSSGCTPSQQIGTFTTQ